MIGRVVALAVLICGLAGCGGSAPPTGPSRNSPLVLSGQSNAMRLEPALRAAYPAGVKTATEPGSVGIELWAPTGRMWSVLRPLLSPVPAAFVWWQDKPDGPLGTGDPAKFADLMSRVRAEAGSPNLLVIVVGVVDKPEYREARLIQTLWVTLNASSGLISVDDLPRDETDSDQLAPAGYGTVAQRVVASLR